MRRRSRWCFPKAVMIDERAEGRVKGRGRDEYHHLIARTGRIHIRLSWEGDYDMMLMTHEAFTQRVDGASPLEIDLSPKRSDDRAGNRDRGGVVHAPGGRGAAYELTVEWEG